MTQSAQISGFRDIANRLELHGNHYQGSIDAAWRQGRTCYGGLTAGLSLTAAKRDFPDLPPLRSMQITFVGPVNETPIFKTSLLRQGRNVTTIEVKALSDNDVSASAIFMFGTARESDISETLPAYSDPAPEIFEDFTPKHIRPFVPKFFLQFETKLVEGGRPASGADKAYIRCWSRHIDPASQNGIDSFITLGDVLPPAAAPTFKKMGPISSMNWQVNILVDDVDSEDGWYLVETAQTAVQGGYSSQIMRFWNRTGVLVAEGIQSVAIFI